MVLGFCQFNRYFFNHKLFKYSKSCLFMDKKRGSRVKTVEKPWGRFKEFVLNKKCTVKIHDVKPHESLSLQKHKHRREEWYFLTPGFVQLGNKKRKVKKGEVIKIRKNQIHRLYSGNKAVRVLEIAYGDFDENDITRLEDKYGRVKKFKK